MVVEFGKSFSQLCRLYPDISCTWTTTEGRRWASTLRPAGEELDNGSIEMLSGVVQKYWRHMFTKDESEKEVALTRFIQDYYENVREGHNFESFYNHVTEHYPEILERKHIPKDYFSLESFSLNCGEFLPGRRYENVQGYGDGLLGKEVHRVRTDADQAGQVSEQPRDGYDIHRHTEEAAQ